MSALRDLPAVDALARRLLAREPSLSRPSAVSIARAVIAARRRELLDGHGGDGDGDLLIPAVERARRSVPPRVLNATGVVLHTNLGRAPLARSAADAVREAALGAVAVELDLRTGRRGVRGEQACELLCELTGAQDALVVNNGAAATLLAVCALAGGGRPVLISRGELVEIGGGFRIPEVVAQSGARLVEVGTTNRTRASDYARAMEDGAVVLRVHRSNFRMVGFTQSPSLEELIELGAPLIDDVGSGVLEALGDEPVVGEAVAAGAALVCCSGDKLLGGPQAGILVGRADAIAACRAHPLARALRVDRLTLAALGATLELHRDPERARREVPVLAMLDADEATLSRRAAMLAAATGGEVVRVEGRVGGGALPLAVLAGPGVALAPAAGGGPDRLARALRAGEPPLLARIVDGRVVLDPRTLTAAEVREAARVVQVALGRVVAPACVPS